MARCRAEAPAISSFTFNSRVRCVSRFDANPGSRQRRMKQTATCIPASLAVLAALVVALDVEPAPAQPVSPPTSSAADRYGAAPITPTPSGAQPSDDPQLVNGGQILARIDGQLVLSADVNWQVQEQIKAVEEQQGRQVPPQQLAEVTKMLSRRYVLGQVHTKLLYADFRRNVPPENMPLIEEQLVKPFHDERVPQLVKMFGVANRVELETRLRSYGSSLKDLQRQFIENAIASEWMKQRVPKPKDVTHEQLLAYYEDHSTDYDYLATAEYEELMSRFDRFGGDRDATWRAICQMGNEVWKKALANPGFRGPVFADVAKNNPHSHGFTAGDGGIHEPVTIGDLRCDAMNKALEELQVGQLSNVIESQDGFHIVRVLERRPAGRTSFEEAQAGIRETLEEQQIQELRAAELMKLLEGASVWTVFDGDLRGEKLVEALGGPITR